MWPAKPTSPERPITGSEIKLPKVLPAAVPGVCWPSTATAASVTRSPASTGPQGARSAAAAAAAQSAATDALRDGCFDRMLHLPDGRDSHRPVHALQGESTLD